MPATQDVPGGNAHQEEGADDPAGRHRVREANERRRIEGGLEEVDHLSLRHTVGVGDDLESVGRLHPGVGGQDPEGREGRAQENHQAGNPAYGRTDAIAPEEHDADEGRLQEEGEDPFRRQWGAEDIADVSGEARPVGAELELHHDTADDADDERDGEELGQEDCEAIVYVLLGPPAERLHDRDESGQTDSDGREYEVEADCQRELETRQSQHIHGRSPPTGRTAAQAETYRNANIMTILRRQYVKPGTATGIVAQLGTKAARPERESASAHPGRTC